MFTFAALFWLANAGLSAIHLNPTVIGVIIKFLVSLGGLLLLVSTAKEFGEDFCCKTHFFGCLSLGISFMLFTISCVFLLHVLSAIVIAAIVKALMVALICSQEFSQETKISLCLI